MVNPLREQSSLTVINDGFLSPLSSFYTPTGVGGIL